MEQEQAVHSGSTDAFDEADAAGQTDVVARAELVDELVDELLIEEISIDGMCGVY